MSEFNINDGLMPKIVALITPPVQGPKVKMIDHHPTFKKRGKRHNHDSCDACGVKGNLIHCDICPTSFHLLCLDPPVVGNAIHYGSWRCRACLLIPTEPGWSSEIIRSQTNLNGLKQHDYQNFDQQSACEITHVGGFASGNKTSRLKKTPNSYKCYKFPRVSVPKCDCLLNKGRVAAFNERVDIKFLWDKKCAETTDILRHKDPIKIPEVFSQIIHNVKRSNPKEFRIPIDYLKDFLDESLLNDSRDADTFTDYDRNDLLKLPPRRCYYCNKNCFYGEMTSCYYCPAHYHLNCLDPPLCSQPEANWMCALHPHHILDKIMVKKDSITELSSWWQKLSISVDEMDVKVEFFKRSRVLRLNSILPTSKHSKVPDIVRHHYQYGCNPVLTIEDVFCKDLSPFFLESEVDDHHSSTGIDNLKKNHCDVANSVWSRIKQLIEEDINFNTHESFDQNALLQKLLLKQKISTLIRDLPPSLKPCSLPYPYFPSWSNEYYLPLLETPLFETHAALCPLSHHSSPVFMYGNILRVGTDFSNDVCLRNYGHCNLVSDFHAVIYYDKISKMYELLNYSAYCTVVDDITYACHITPTKFQGSINLTDVFFETNSLHNKSETRSPSSEARNANKKLVQDINKFVIIAQKSMAAVADEDINEISKMIKLNEVALVESKKQSPRKRFHEAEDCDYVNDVNEKEVASELIADSESCLKNENRNCYKFLRANGNQQGMKQSHFSSASKKMKYDFLCINSLSLPNKKILCQCQFNNMKIPITRDHSWETAAPLYHGSYIRFGCLEFVFCIVNYPVEFENRLYVARLNERVPRTFLSSNNTKIVPHIAQSDELSWKLMSILNNIPESLSDCA